MGAGRRGHDVFIEVEVRRTPRTSTGRVSRARSRGRRGRTPLRICRQVPVRLRLGACAPTHGDVQVQPRPWGHHAAHCTGGDPARAYTGNFAYKGLQAPPALHGSFGLGLKPCAAHQHPVPSGPRSPRRHNRSNGPQGVRVPALERGGSPECGLGPTESHQTGGRRHRQEIRQ